MTDHFRIVKILTDFGNTWIQPYKHKNSYESTDQINRYHIAEKDGLYRLRIWFGSLQFPLSIPDFYDSDGIDFAQHDIICHPVYNVKYHAIISINDRYGLSSRLEDTYNNIFLYDKQQEKLVVRDVDELEQKLDIYKNRVLSHPLTE